MTEGMWFIPGRTEFQAEKSRSESSEPPGMSRDRKDIRRLLEEDVCLFLDLVCKADELLKEMKGLMAEKKEMDRKSFADFGHGG